MKTRNLLITIGAAALAAITINATAADALLSPRAAGNQIKHVSGFSNDPNLVAANRNVSSTGALLSPRAASIQIKTVPGVANDVNPALMCIRNMVGSPRAITACIEHPGNMPVCNSPTVAPLK